MNTHRLEQSQWLARPVGEVFAFFSDAANLERMTPGFLNFRILTPLPIAMGVDTRIDYRIALFGIPMKWRTRITRWEPGRLFCDEQEAGPYALWRHTHSFEPQGTGTLMRDVVEYALPFGPLGKLAHGLFVERTVRQIFDFRKTAIVGAMGIAA
jgi:ligand-binding SRPBCC domain-containing protein